VKRPCAAVSTGSLAASLMMVLAACGGTAGNGGGTPSATASASAGSLSAFISEADAACSASVASVAAVPTPNVSSLTSPAPSDLPAIAGYYASVIPVFQGWQAALQQLGSPPSMQSTWSGAMTALAAAISDFQALQSAAQSGDLTTYASVLSTEQSDNSTLNQDFAEFGATGCAGSSSSASASATATPS
jgi:hypothetical protein